MVLNEVYTGAGLSATLIPEIDLELSELVGTLNNSVKKISLSANTDAGKKILTWTVGSNTTLVTDLYKGCMAEVGRYEDNSGTLKETVTLMIKSNTANTITFNQTLSDTHTDDFTCKILAFGTPCPYPRDAASKPRLNADNWLGLVNTISPPTVDAEMKQLNMALGGTRNFNYQYKGSETVGNASIDVSLSNGSWLYYALGGMSISHASGQTTGTSTLASTLTNDFNGQAYSKTASGTNIYKVDNGGIFPPLPSSATASQYRRIVGYTTYQFSENDSGDLPSFALDVTAEKSNVTYSTQDATDDKRKHYSKIYTGMQVNTLTLNFEEGQEVKATIDAVCRKAHDAEEEYTPKAGVQVASDLFNYKALSVAGEAENQTRTGDDTKPFMYSDGSVKMFGQTLARVKSGSITITNNLTPQRYIGNYDRTIASAHVAGQRTYEIQLSMLIVDNTMWNELRKQNETGLNGESTTGDIEIEFVKDGNANDKIELKLKDYLTTAVDIPFPDDKGPLEVSLTAQARTFGECTYTGKWVIQG